MPHNPTREHQEIIGSKPGWLIRSGSSLLLGVLLLILFMSWMIKYPESLNSQISLTSDNRPVLITSRTSSHLVLNDVDEGQAVNEDEILGYIRNTKSMG